MTLLDYETVMEAVYEAGGDEENVRADYSGRSMYGAECFGIVHSSQTELLVLVAGLAVAGVDLGFLRNARMDSMGLDMITYFPGTTLTGVPA